MALPIPVTVEAVFREFRTCEFSTLAADGTPITWPMLPFWRPDTGQFMTTTSIGLPDKALNIGRNPRVSLLFSDPTEAATSTRRLSWCRLTRSLRTGSKPRSAASKSRHGRHKDRLRFRDPVQVAGGF